jgi:beta-phosphoglucomutase-like phosphatase (HAD superfamily)
MQVIEAVLFEPVGCLGEFTPEPFLELAARLSGRQKQTSKSGSRAYWHLLNLLEGSRSSMPAELELKAIDTAMVYDDVLPALDELKAMNITRVIASSLSSAAIECFLRRCPHDFDAICSRDNSGGIKAAPLACALKTASLIPAHTMFLTDTAEGLKVAGSVGVHAVLMMNDPEESKRLAQQKPAGGVVSLHELPDFIRLLRAQNALTT